MPGFLSPGKGGPLLLVPEYSGINKGQRFPDRSITAHEKPPVKCFLTVNSFEPFHVTFFAHCDLRIALLKVYNSFLTTVDRGCLSLLVCEDLLTGCVLGDYDTSLIHLQSTPGYSVIAMNWFLSHDF